MANDTARFVLLISYLVLASSVARAQAQIIITEAEYGEAWPFTVPEGQLRCEGGGLQAVVFRANGIDYAVNGVAMAKYAAIEPIWRLNEKLTSPDFPIRINIGPIIDRGLKLCRGGRP